MQTQVVLARKLDGKFLESDFVSSQERLYRPEVVEVCRGATCPLFGAQAFQVVLAAQAIQDAIEGFLHLRRGHIAGVDGAQFSGPIVEVLIDMVVDRLKVGGVKAASKRRCLKLSKANNRRIRRRSGESGRVRDAELVSEYAGAGDCEVGCVNHLRFSPLTGEAVAGDWRSAAMTRPR